MVGWCLEIARVFYLDLSTPSTHAHMHPRKLGAPTGKTTFTPNILPAPLRVSAGALSGLRCVRPGKGLLWTSAVHHSPHGGARTCPHCAPGTRSVFSDRVSRGSPTA